MSGERVRLNVVQPNNTAKWRCVNVVMANQYPMGGRQCPGCGCVFVGRQQVALAEDHRCLNRPQPATNGEKEGT